MNNSDKLEALHLWGADTASALGRMLNDDVFYLNLLKVFLTSSDWNELLRLISAKMYVEAFIISHRMKGSSADLSLTPLFNALCELTDDLRNEVRPTLDEDLKIVLTLRDSLNEIIL